MKLLYIANIRLPTEKAHGIQIMKMCEAFSDLGHEVALVVPKRLNAIKKNAFEFYKINETFKIVSVPILDVVSFGRIGFWIETFIFSICAAVYALHIKPDLIYSRDEVPAWLATVFGKEVVWEAHSMRMNFFIRWLLRKLKTIVVITDSLREFYCKLSDGQKFIVAHDGVDMEMFLIDKEKRTCRQLLNLPSNKKIALYTGHLYAWKGVQVLAEASLLLGEDWEVVFVGGIESDVLNFSEQNKDNNRIRVIGYRSYKEMPIWMRAADVLVLPNSDERPTSPMKLFEYMASQTPIVASSTRSIREILNNEMAILVEPNNPSELASALEIVANNSGKARTMADMALHEVEKYTWSKRAETILSRYFIHE